MTKFFIPPITILLAWFLVFVSEHAGRATFLRVRPLLALTFGTSLFSCIYVVMRLWPKRSEAQFRQAFLLNVTGIIASTILLLLFGFASRPLN